MAVIHQDFIGLYTTADGYVVRPEKETSFKVGDRPKTYHHSNTAGISVKLNDVKEIWTTAGLTSNYRGLKKALKLKKINEQEFREFVVFDQLFNLKNNKNYVHLITEDYWNWSNSDGTLSKENMDKYKQWKNKVKQIIYDANGWKLN